MNTIIKFVIVILALSILMGAILSLDSNIERREVEVRSELQSMGYVLVVTGYASCQNFVLLNQTIFFHSLNSNFKQILELPDAWAYDFVQIRQFDCIEMIVD